MTLQKLLLALSKNADYYADCHVFDGKMDIVMKEFWYHREETKVQIDLSKNKIEQEVLDKLHSYIKTK